MTDSETLTDEEQKARMQLIQMISGYRLSALMQVCASLGIADHLQDGPRTVTQLADLTDTDTTSLHRFLRALAILGIVREIEPARFELPALGRPLRKDAPDSVHRAALGATDEGQFRVWADLENSVRTGEVAFEHLNGISAFDFFAQHPEINAAFNRQMSDHTRQFAPYLLAKYDFSPFHTIVDVGGGDGTLLAAILDATPNVRGVIFDTAAGAEAAPQQIAKRGLADRCEIVTGDFFTSVPGGGDAYVMKSIIHDWSDERATTLLRNCRAAMRDGARLLVLDIVLPPVIEDLEVNRVIVFSDINMLLNTGGRERTEVEHRSLLETAGFRLTSVTPLDTPWGYCVIEGTPA